MTRAFNFGIKIAVGPVMTDQSGAVNQHMPANNSQYGNVGRGLRSGNEYSQNADLDSAKWLHGDDSPDNWAANNATKQQMPANRLGANSLITTPTVGQPFLPQTATPPAASPAPPSRPPVSGALMQSPSVGPSPLLRGFEHVADRLHAGTDPLHYQRTRQMQAKAPVAAPLLGKAGSLIAIGAKLAASTCSPCDMPNSPANKKHMTGASPAVTEAGEKSEEIGKPEVTETEHSEAEAKQPEEGIKSAANPKAYGKAVAGLLNAAKPAASAVSAAPVARTAFGTGRQIARPPLPKPPRSLAEIARAKELGLKPGDYVDGTPFATPNTRPRGIPNSANGPLDIPIPQGGTTPLGFDPKEILKAQGARMQPVRRSDGGDTMRTLAGPGAPPPPPPVPPRQ